MHSGRRVGFSVVGTIKVYKNADSVAPLTGVYPSRTNEEIEADGCVERPRPDTRPEAILTEQDRVIFHRDRENVHFCMRKGGGTMA